MKNKSSKHNVNDRKSIHIVPRPVKRIERLVVELFREHWSSLRRYSTIVQKRERFFFSTSERERIQMARRYYAPERVRRLAQASNDHVLRLCKPWLGFFCEYALFCYLNVRELRKEIKQLVGAEYVAVVEVPPRPDDPLGDVKIVRPLPDLSVRYGDVYEITASGFSVGSYLCLYKSVAKPFGKKERILVQRGLSREFFENSAEEGEEKDAWVITFRKPTDSRVVEMDVSPKS